MLIITHFFSFSISTVTLTPYLYIPSHILYFYTFYIVVHIQKTSSQTEKHDTNFGYSCVLWVVCGFSCSESTTTLFLKLDGSILDHLWFDLSSWWSTKINQLSCFFLKKLTTIPFRNCGGFGECEKMKKNCDHYAWPCDS